MNAPEHDFGSTMTRPGMDAAASEQVGATARSHPRGHGFRVVSRLARSEPDEQIRVTAHAATEGFVPAVAATSADPTPRHRRDRRVLGLLRAG